MQLIIPEYPEVLLSFKKYIEPWTSRTRSEHSTTNLRLNKGRTDQTKAFSQPIESSASSEIPKPVQKSPESPGLTLQIERTLTPP